MTEDNPPQIPDEKVDAELVRIDPSEFEDGDEFDPEDFAEADNDSDEKSADFEEEN